MKHGTRVAVTSVVLVALLVFFGLGARWGYQEVTAPAPEAVPTPCVSTDVGKALKPEQVSVRVLNGGLVSGLAKNTGTYLRAYGFRVIRVNNIDERITKTVILGNSVDDPEVKLVAGFFPDAELRGDGRVDHVVDVLLGEKFQQVAKPKTSLSVDGPVCLPPLPSDGSTSSASPKASPAKSAKK